MLAVKQIAPDGTEFLSEIESFEYRARRPQHCAQVVITGLSGRSDDAQIITEGQVYVMNDKGRTIGNYNLSLDNGLEGQTIPAPQKRFEVIEASNGRFVLLDRQRDEPSNRIFTSRALAEQAALAMTA